MILVISMLASLVTYSQKQRPAKRAVRDSVVEVIYTDGTRRKMVWINDSTVMLVISSKDSKVSSKAYIDPEFAERQKRYYYFIKFEE